MFKFVLDNNIHILSIMWNLCQSDVITNFYLIIMQFVIIIT